MAHTVTIRTAIDPKTKRATESVLKRLGMTPTEAIRLFYSQIALRKAFPLELRIPNATTIETLRKSDAGEELESFDSVDEMFASWRQR